MFHHFKIISNSPTSIGAQVLMDGKPIEGLRGIEVRMHVNDVTTIVLELLPGSVDLESVALVERAAHPSAQVGNAVEVTLLSDSEQCFLPIPVEKVTA